MKITMLLVIAGCFLNTAAFATPGPQSAKCKEIADKMRQAKAATQESPAATPATARPANAQGVQ